MWFANIGSNMNNSLTQHSINGTQQERTLDIVNRGLKKRYRAERRFRFYGLLAIVASMVFLSLLFISIIGKGYTAFLQTFVELNVFFDPEILDEQALATADYQGGLIHAGLLGCSRFCL